MLFLFLFCAGTASATKIKGHVYDKQTGEAIVGATVMLENPKRITNTGLDGTFEFKGVAAGPARISVSYITYKTITKSIVVLKEDNDHLKFYLESDSKSLDDVTIKTNAVSATDQGARRLEKNATQVMNIVSGRAIEISPDLTVANVMQRVSGVSIERNSNGDGQYAILRGMDKRYNYTLVNGVKIPSPDNKYRYVPLIFFRLIYSIVWKYTKP